MRKAQRIQSSVYRVRSTQAEEQATALERLEALTSWLYAFDTWLSTKPAPEAVERVATAKLLQSPMYKTTRQPLDNTTVTDIAF